MCKTDSGNNVAEQSARRGMSGGMKFLLWLLALVALISAALVLLAKKGFGNNGGAEFYGSEFIEIAKEKGGFGNNGGAKFYSDAYIKEKFAAKE